MDEVRDKLIDILATVPMAETVMSGLRAGKHSCYAAFMADHLIANGVTVQRWIPVTERLPKPGQEIIVYDGGVQKPKVFAYQFWNKEYDSWARITHWMPLPQAPGKEGA